MKIYFAYRSAYIPNLRYLKAFEADSILGWFTSNWGKLTSDTYSELFGTHVYGFPISDYRSDAPIPPPSDMQALISTLSKFVYCNEIEGDDDCLQVLTDDDEIELAWYLFTEEYSNKNKEKCALWLLETMSTEFGKTGGTLEKSVTKLLPEGGGTGTLYYVTCPIYDSGNFDDLECLRIEGTRLDGFLDYLRNSDKLSYAGEAGAPFGYGVDEIRFLQFLAKQHNDNDLVGLLKDFSSFPVTDIEKMDYEEADVSTLREMALGNDPEKSKVSISDHFCELCVNTKGVFFNYHLLFDDLWVQRNETLARSILHFGSSVKM